MNKREEAIELYWNSDLSKDEIRKKVGAKVMYELGGVEGIIKIKMESIINQKKKHSYIKIDSGFEGKIKAYLDSLKIPYEIQNIQ